MLLLGYSFNEITQKLCRSNLEFNDKKIRAKNILNKERKFLINDFR